MEKLKQILTSNKAKTFAWTTLNSSIVLLIAMLNDGDINLGDAVITALVIAGLNFTTKYIAQNKLSV